MECAQINQLQTFANSDSGTVSNRHVWPTLKHPVFLPRTDTNGHNLRFQTHPLLSGLCIWLWYFECRFALQTTHVTSIVVLTSKNHQLWLEQSGQFTRGLKCIHLFFQTVSTHLKPPRSPTRQQALNVHFKTAWDVVPQGILRVGVFSNHLDSGVNAFSTKWVAGPFQYHATSTQL